MYSITDKDKKAVKQKVKEIFAGQKVNKGEARTNKVPAPFPLFSMGCGILELNDKYSL